MSIADKGKTPLELSADRALDGRFFLGAVRWSQLNPEQQLAYSMERLLSHQKETLMLMETVNLMAKECIEWRKTPEGVAWTEKQKAKRDAAAAKAAP